MLRIYFSKTDPLETGCGNRSLDAWLENGINVGWRDEILLKFVDVLLSQQDTLVRPISLDHQDQDCPHEVNVLLDDEVRHLDEGWRFFGDETLSRFGHEVVEVPEGGVDLEELLQGETSSNFQKRLQLWSVRLL